jgi:hypothetical protein
MNKQMIIGACSIAVLGVGIAFAHPPGKGPHLGRHVGLRQAEDAESLGQSSQLGPSCTECRATTTASNEKNATVYCRSSGDIKWPPCKKTYKTVTHGPPGKQRRYRRATYENNEGEECRFVETSAAKCSNG